MWALWWVWVAAGLGLALLEIFAPGYVFLGFAAGAVLTGLVLLSGLPPATALAGSFPLTLLFFALVSLVAWWGMRRIFGVRKGQTKLWDRDINED